MFPLSRILQRARLRHPERTAVVDGDLHLTFGQLGDRADRLVAALRRHGLQPGDRVACLDRNSHRYLEAYYACAQAGFVFVPINFRLSAKEVGGIVADCQPRALLVAAPFRELVAAPAEGAHRPEIVFALEAADAPAGWKTYESEIGAADPVRDGFEPNPDDIAVIYYTGGTTGTPKGVCLSHANLYYGAIDGVSALEVRADDVWMHAAPLFHLASALYVWSMPMAGGCQLMTQYEPKRVTELFAGGGVTMTAMPAAMITPLAAAARARNIDMSRVRRVLYGGGPTPRGALEDIAGVFGHALTHCYAMTETSALITILGPADHVFAGDAKTVKRTFSAGQPTAMVEIKVVDEAGAELPAGAIGELTVCGPKVMRGYWRKDAETVAALRNGWLRTGDLGYRDENGYVFIVDRKKDMIISGGENIYPAEIENVISVHPGVSEVVVIGIPDSRWIEAVHAIVVPRQGAEISPEDILATCRASLGGFKIPKSVEIRTGPLPMTGPGKIARKAIRDEFWQGKDRRI